MLKMTTMARRRILRASWVVPVSAPPIANGALAVSDGRIEWVGRFGDPAGPSGAITDLGTGVLLPGLTNAHCHLELSHLSGALPRSDGFVPWLEALVERRGRAEPALVAARTRAAIAELEATGTVAVGDVSNALDHLDMLAASPLRAVVFYELLGWDPARARSILDSAVARIDALAGRMNGRLRLRMAAHAPHSVSPELLRLLAEHECPAAIHLAESEAEAAFLGEGDGEWGRFLGRRGLGHVAFTPPGLSPVQYLDSLGILRPGLLAAHCVRVDAADRRTLARRGVRVAVCPRSNRGLDVGLPPVPALLESGVRVCLGTDSLASADSLDLLADAALLHESFPGISPAALVEMATAAGAEALGFDGLGTLAPGKSAEMAFAAAPRDVADPCAFVVSGEARARRVAA
jgi:cytosine/adenosine deaminase-related metal-dependent hydrolase